MTREPELQSYLAAIINSTDDAVISMTLDGVVTSWNPAATQLFGYTPHEAIGRSIMMLVPPELQNEEVEILSRLRTGETFAHYESCRMRKDGTTLDVSLTISPIRSSSRDIVGASTIARDITDRKKAEHAVLQLAAIVESSEDPIISKNLDGIITSWNAAATRVFGYTADEAVGRSILLIIPPDLRHEETEILARLRAGQKIEHYETRRQRKNGTLVDVSLTISPLRDSRGRVIGASKIARDVTQRNQAEEALRNSEKLAVAGRLAATVAHEINNPLAAITNLVFLIKTDSTLGKETRERIGIIEEELERVCSIARQTLGFYRDTSSPADFSLTDVVEEVLTIFGRRMLAHQISLHADLRDVGRVCGYKGELRQVISNLIANAIDATGVGGRIVVRLENTRLWNGVDSRKRHDRISTPQAHVRMEHSHQGRPLAIAGDPGSPNTDIPGIRLTIADTGHGIPAELKSRLFQPFVTTNKETGTGLGLWHAAGLVEKHGGVIRYRSSTRPGKSGTVFSIFLPARQAAAATRRVA